MQLITSLANENSPKTPSILTIGNFDGMHKGHLTVLQETKTLARSKNCPLTVLTFENHPSEVLRPAQQISLICTPIHKLKLLEAAGTDTLILLPFTKELSQHTAEVFLNLVHISLPFTHLVLGHDATLGKDRQGDRQQILVTAATLGFAVKYLDPFTINGTVVSSSLIRRLIQQGQLDQVTELLGRKYSIYGPVIRGASKGKGIGFPTANLDVSQLCLPPFGVYAVQLIHQGKTHHAIANLGVAPTIRNDQKPILEVHLLGIELDLYGQIIEVFFHNFIRPEIQFSSIEMLKKQIADDILKARYILKNIK